MEPNKKEGRKRKEMNASKKEKETKEENKKENMYVSKQERNKNSDGLVMALPVLTVDLSELPEKRKHCSDFEHYIQSNPHITMFNIVMFVSCLTPDMFSTSSSSSVS